ncbi:hypothetical protein WJX81_003848 [Elliptochloris bilobata]|uniref:Translocator protein n=1 Tax=Elliptochloris bilobata TaxID=381761 RepID=A0AAW1SIR9_9CHLO
MGAALSVALFVVPPLAISCATGFAMKDEVKGWYKRLNKPSWTPPGWVFGPVWTVLYTVMGLSAREVWKHTGLRGLPLTLYAVQLALNFAWSPLFFMKHEIGLALADISALLGVLTATMVSFHKVSPAAAYALGPYFLWSSYAAALTASIYRHNPGERGRLSRRAGAAAEDAAQDVSSTAQAADVKGGNAATEGGKKAV